MSRKPIFDSSFQDRDRLRDSTRPSNQSQDLPPESEKLRNMNDPDLVNQDLNFEGPAIIRRKVQTIITETKPVFDENAIQRQRDLEFDLTQLDQALRKKDIELENLRLRIQMIPALEFKVNTLEDENASLRKQISEIIKEVEVLRTERGEFIRRNQLDMDEKVREIELLKKRLREFESLPGQLTLARQNIDTLSSELDRVTGMLKASDAEIYRMRGAFEQFEFENQNLKMKIAEFEGVSAELTRLRGIHDQIVHQRDDLSSLLDEREDEIEKLKQELARLASVPQVSRQQIDELTRRNNSLLADMALLQKDLSLRDQKLEELMLLIGDLRAKESSLRQSLQAAIRERDSLIAKLDAMRREFEPIMRERDNLLVMLREKDAQIIEVTQTLHNMTPELEHAGNRIIALEEELKSLRIILGSSQSETQRFKARIAELEGMIVEIGQLRAFIDKLTKERDGLILSLRERDVQLEALRSDFDRLSNDLKVRGGELEALKQKAIDVETLQRELKARDKTIGDVYLKLENWRMKEKTLADSVKVLNGEKDNLLAQVEALRIQLSQVLPERDSLVAALRERDEQIVALNTGLSELETLRAKLNQIIPERDNLIAALRNKDQQIVALNAEVSQLQAFRAQLSQIMPERDNLIAALRNKEDQIVALNAGLNKLTLENERLRSMLAEFEKSRVRFSTQIRERDIEIESLKKANQGSLVELEALRERIRFFEPEMQRLQLLVREQEKELIALRGQLQGMADLQSKINTLSLQNNELRAQIAPIDKLKSEVLQLRQLVDSLTIKRDNLLALLQEKENELKRLRPILAEFEMMKSRYGEYSREIERLNALVAQGAARIKELELIVANLQQLENSQKLLLAENEELKRGNASLVLRTQELEETLSIINTKYQELEISYNEIRDAAKDLGQVQKKLLDACVVNERLDTSLRQTIAETNVHHIDKTSIINQDFEDFVEGGQRFTEAPQRF